MAVVESVSHRQATDDRWMNEAACKGLTHLFFALPAERPQARDRRESLARRVCASCSVQDMLPELRPARTTSTASGAVRARTSATPPATA